MSYSIILQYPYETIQIALCHNGTILSSKTEHKFNAIRFTIPHIQTLLQEHNLTLTNLDFITVNVGPGPYNTLRALLTMANGIHFVTNVPLIKCDALQLLTDEHGNDSVIILNAFLDHVFFQLNVENTMQRGACSILELIKILQQNSKSLTAVGNGALTYKALILEKTQNVAFSDSCTTFNSLTTLAKQSFNLFNLKKFDSNYAKPMYFEDLKIKQN